MKMKLSVIDERCRRDNRCCSFLAVVVQAHKCARSVPRPTAHSSPRCTPFVCSHLCAATEVEGQRRLERSQAANWLLHLQKPPGVDVFAVHFNEELSAFDGDLLHDQVEHVIQCIDVILESYRGRLRFKTVSVLLGQLTLP